MLYPFPLKSSISQTETWVGRFIDFHFLTAKDAKIRSKGNKAFLNHRGTETQSKTKQIFFLSFFGLCASVVQNDFLCCKNLAVLAVKLP
ncbi:MAG: hypothetical protein CMJ19_14195 [Phycisphaeraceae bacterium]|nr:hypothetical protein [Phycisphaeraceae bacterium]